jgi:DNA-binding response OmpR family regulator
MVALNMLGDLLRRPMSSHPRILVVEDEALISEMRDDALSEDYEVVCADNVAQALLAIRGQRIDVILLDAHLHGETGAAVGKHPKQTKVPLIWMIGDPDALVNFRRGRRHCTAETREAGPSP